eukprot:3686504-Pyramimonas_sp.AAC.1
MFCKDEKNNFVWRSSGSRIGDEIDRSSRFQTNGQIWLPILSAPAHCETHAEPHSLLVWLQPAFMGLFLFLGLSAASNN